MKLIKYGWENFHYHFDMDDMHNDINTPPPTIQHVRKGSKIYHEWNDTFLPHIADNSIFDFSKDNWDDLKFLHDNFDSKDFDNEVIELIDNFDNEHPNKRIKFLIDNWKVYMAIFYFIEKALEKKDWKKECSKDYKTNKYLKEFFKIESEIEGNLIDIEKQLQDAYNLLKVTKTDDKYYAIYAPTKNELRQIIEFVDSDSNLNWVDVSGLTDLSGLFRNLSFFNGDISLWNVCNSTNMEEMFSGCTEFNGDLREWEIQTTANTKNMFTKCNIKDNHKPTIR